MCCVNTTIEKQTRRSLNWLIQVKNKNGYGETQGPVLGQLGSYLSDYEEFLKNKTKRFYDKAQTYCQGIFMSELSNIERISEEMFANYHQMQHFITGSSRDYRALMDQVSKDVSNSLPKRKLTGLIIDESGWEKKGDKSVGVSPQYCGNAGKIATTHRWPYLVR